MLLIVAVPVASKASVVVASGLGLLAAFVVVAAAMVTPIFLDLWSVVKADRTGIRWRNRLITRSLAWSEVAGFERGPVSMALRRTDGKLVSLRALGLRYFGSKNLATQRIAVLEGLRAKANR